MKNTVIVTTYNGEKYIEEQLKSILMQTCSPQEVIISDDGSIDKTTEIINEFIKKNYLEEKWRLIECTERKGVTKNFIDTAKLAKGEFIFFSDQDDQWELDKIEKMSQVLLNYSVRVVACTSICIDSKGNEKKSLCSKVKSGDGKLHFSSFTEQIRDTRSSGHALAFKKDILIEISEWIVEYDLPFDLPFALYATATDKKFALLQVPLVKRRVHDNNASTPTFTLKEKVENWGTRVKSVELKLKLMKATYYFWGKDVIGEKDYRCLKRSIIFLEKHLSHLQKREPFKLFKDMFYCNPMIWRILLIVDFLSAFFKGIKK